MIRRRVYTRHTERRLAASHGDIGKESDKESFTYTNAAGSRPVLSRPEVLTSLELSLF
jgi:hypothetical protein